MDSPLHRGRLYIGDPYMLYRVPIYIYIFRSTPVYSGTPMKGYPIYNECWIIALFAMINELRKDIRCCFIDLSPIVRL